MFKSIASKMTLLFTCLAVFFTVITGLVFIALYGNHVRDSEKETMQSCATNVAQLISKGNLFADSSGLSLAMQTAGEYGYYIWVSDVTGKFYSFDKENLSPSTVNSIKDSEERSFVRTVLSGTSSIGSDFEDLFSKDEITVGVPIYASSKVIGAVFLHSKAENFSGVIKTSYFYILLAVIFAIGVALAVSFLFSGQFTRPINGISEAATKMANGDFDVHIDYLSQPEFNTVAENINSIASMVRSSANDVSTETAKLSNIIETITDGIAAYDTNMHLVRYNAALLTICDEDYFERSDVKNAMLEVMETGETKTLNIENKGKILSFTITQTKARESVEGIVAVVSDITERERLEETRREFVSNVSHEFRTPLTVIRGAVELLMDDVLPDEESKKECYKKIDTESAALSNLVRDLLDTSRMKSGRIKIEPHEVDINELALVVTENMQGIASNKKIKINYEPVSIPPVWGDDARIRQLMIIFIDNAIKFTPEKGTITVSIYSKNDKAYLCVKDTGVGIPKEDQPYLFERFYKVDKARGGSETGTGLGLAIAWQIAKLHKGTILVESEIGKGTTFKTVLPLASETDVEEE